MLEQADREPDLQQELNKAVEADGNKASAFVAAAAKRGYDFTPEEFNEVVAASQDGALSEKDLAHVAGGATGVPGRTVFSSTTMKWASQISVYLR